MPIFEYRCDECDHVTAFLEKAGAKNQHACESCGSTKTRKILSTFAAQVGSSAQPSCPRRGECTSGTCPLA